MPRNIPRFLSLLTKNYKNSFWWNQQIAMHINGNIQHLRNGNNGVFVMEQDWDNLLVLDACRADEFERVFETEQFDSYHVERSNASATPEWVRNNFVGRSYGDTVYLNANPYVSRKAPDAFHNLIDLWAEEFSEQHQTVPPEPVTQRAKTMVERYPKKRLIAHYVQPHGPYLGEPGLDWDREKAAGSGEAVFRGLITPEEFRDAYRANLEYMKDDVLELATTLPGKTVITSDHGELFGERLRPIPVKGCAHPLNLRTDGLTKVPWAVLSGDRRNIIDDGTRDTTVDSEEELSNRLQDLGYLE